MSQDISYIPGIVGKFSHLKRREQRMRIPRGDRKAAEILGRLIIACMDAENSTSRGAFHVCLIAIL